MASKSNALIAKLLEAEQQAEQIVSVARDARVKALKEARDAAQAETETYKRKEEEKFVEASQGLRGQADQASFDKQAEVELKEVQKDLARNQNAAVDYIFSKVMSVDTVLPMNQAAALKIAG